MGAYGLIGEKLGHSFSKTIHERLGFYSYDLLPMDKIQLKEFMTKREFSGVNVTIPYKLDVIEYCDEIDESVKSIGSANTIINKDGKLKAYNTDFNGLLYTISINNIDLYDKNIIILGNGGTSKTAQAVAKHLGAKKVAIVELEISDETITYAQALKMTETQAIINATPVGMFPNNQNSPIDLSSFPNLEAVVDVIYNPVDTKLIQQAKKLGLKTTNGLPMLVAQAKYAAEIFIGKPIPDEIIETIYNELRASLSNLVLVGMPSCGKSTIARMLSSEINKTYVDVDFAIESQENMKIPEIFSKYGEAHFRKLESEKILELSKQTGQIIATGGGAVLNSENIDNLKQNGIIIFVDRKLDKLLVGNGRPLSKDIDALSALYEKRYPIYQDCCDACVENDCEIKKAVNLAKEKFYEAISN